MERTSTSSSTRSCSSSSSTTTDTWLRSEPRRRCNDRILLPQMQDILRQGHRENPAARRLVHPQEPEAQLQGLPCLRLDTDRKEALRMGAGTMTDYICDDCGLSSVSLCPGLGLCPTCATKLLDGGDAVRPTYTRHFEHEQGWTTCPQCNRNTLRKPYRVCYICAMPKQYQWVCSCGRVRVKFMFDGDPLDGSWHCTYCGESYTWRA
jgi:hypothetical protein